MRVLIILNSLLHIVVIGRILTHNLFVFFSGKLRENVIVPSIDRAAPGIAVDKPNLSKVVSFPDNFNRILNLLVVLLSDHTVSFGYEVHVCVF